MKKLDDDKDHIVGENIILKEQWHIENILAWSISMKTFLSYFFWDFTWGGRTSKQFENNSTNWVNVTLSVYFVLLLPKVWIQKVLNLMLTFINFSVALVNYVGQFLSNLSLFRWNVLSISCSCIKETNVILKFIFPYVDRW